MMFPKIDKKILIISVIVLALIILLGFAAYRYLTVISFDVDNFAGGLENEAKIEPEPESKPGLSICADRCGDGICQPPDPECKSTMNCTCPENPQECPQDCK